MTKRRERTAGTSSLISTATIPKVLSGIDFLNSKNDLKEYAVHNLRKEEIEYADAVLDILEHLPSKRYSNMTDVEHVVEKIK
jgi:hypothetical protein